MLFRCAFLLFRFMFLFPFIVQINHIFSIVLIVPMRLVPLQFHFLNDCIRVQSNSWKVLESITFFRFLIPFSWCISIELLSEKLLSLHTPSSIYVVFNYSFFSSVLLLLLFFLTFGIQAKPSVYQFGIIAVGHKIKATNFFWALSLWDERPKPIWSGQKRGISYALGSMQSLLSNETMQI